MNRFVLYDHRGTCLSYFACDTIAESRIYFKSLFPKLEQAFIVNSNTHRCSDF